MAAITIMVIHLYHKIVISIIVTTLCELSDKIRIKRNIWNFRIFQHLNLPRKRNLDLRAFFLFPQTTHAVGNNFFFLNDIYQQSWILPRCQDTNQYAPSSSDTDSPRLMPSVELGHKLFTCKIKINSRSADFL